MEIIHKTVTIPESHTISITLPKNIMPGEVEMVMILDARIQSEPHDDNTTSSALSNSESLKQAALSKLADLLNDSKNIQGEKAETLEVDAEQNLR